MMTDIYNQNIVATNFLILDFETVTPKGRPPEPIELAALRVVPGKGVDRSFRFDRLIKPPDGAPITYFDTAQTGIRSLDVIDAESASIVLRQFDEALSGVTCVLVAQNARYESSILRRFATDCPHAATAPMIDTVGLAKHCDLGLPNNKLDTLAYHFGIKSPTNRHRAMPDVEITCSVFLSLLSTCERLCQLKTVADLIRIAGVSKLEDRSVQASLFD